MVIQNKLAQQGTFLFRWRSFIPLLLLAPGVMALPQSAIFEFRYGDLLDEIWIVIGLLISIVGLAVRWVTVGYVPGNTSGRNTKEQRADHLNTDGMYSIVKNPLYLGNFFAILGVLVSIKVWWLMLIGSLAYCIYIERIIAAEESFLARQYGTAYTDWADKTPIFVPDFRLWRKPSMSFSFRTVLKREYNGVMAVAAAFFITEFIIDVGFQHEPLRLWLHEDWPWVTGFVLGSLVFFTLRTIKKHTRLLKVEGR